MKALFDLFPLLVFFVAYTFVDIFFATAAAMVASAIQVVWSWLSTKKVPPMLWFGFAAFMIFGSMTLIMHDKRFIMVKPTIVYWAMASGFLIAHLFFRKNVIRLAMDKQFDAPDRVWNRWLLIWIAYFAVLGVFNLALAFSVSEAMWVKFKVFGALTGTMLLTLLQIWRMYPYLRQDEDEAKPAEQPGGPPQ